MKDYCFHNSPFVVHIQSQMNPICSITPHIFKINFNVILLPKHMSPIGPFMYVYPTKLLYAFLMPIMFCRSHPLHSLTLII